MRGADYSMQRNIAKGSSTMKWAKRTIWTTALPMRNRPLGHRQLRRGLILPTRRRSIFAQLTDDGIEIRGAGNHYQPLLNLPAWPQHAAMPVGDLAEREAGMSFAALIE